MLKIIIAGSRYFNDKVYLIKVMDNLLRNRKNEEIEIISGMANGADSFGKEYAEEKGIKLIQMPANWDKYGMSAGYRRNEEMAQIATHCVCFWDGKSKGTKHMINLAQRYNLILKVYRY